LHGLHQKHHFPLLLYPTAAVEIACLRSRHSVMAVSAGFKVFALSKYATLYQICDMYSKLESEYNKVRTMIFINMMH
jgi:hypothetical protein